MNDRSIKHNDLHMNRLHEKQGFMERQHVQEQATLWRDSGLSDLEVMHASYLTHSFVPHRHASFVSSVIDQGVGTLRYRGATHIAPAGSLVLLNPDEIHTGQVYGTQGWTYRAIYPSTELVAQLAFTITERSWPAYFSPTPILFDQTLAGLLRCLQTALAENSSLLERESWLLNTYSYLLTRYAERPLVARSLSKEPRAVHVAREYLEAHFAHNISLAQLARETGLSPFHLARTFHQLVGLPPHAYLNQIRLEHAKRLLLAGHSIATVTYEVGFADQSHLTRRFKRVYGVTPGHVFQNRKNRQD
jgi:AraC-like DNA-binding protein